MNVVGHITLGPEWKKGLSANEQGAPMQKHLLHMRDLFESGSLSLGGPYVSGHGGLAVFDAASLADAQVLANADPAFQAGVIEYRLEALNAVFDKANGTNRYQRLAGVLAGGGAT